MQHSDAPFVELERARRAAEAMRQTQSLEDLEEQWKEYLRRLERVWNKAENHFRKSPKWHSWNGRFKTLRAKDQLLAYLINARGADEHTVSEITEREAQHLTVDTPDGYGHVHLRTGSRGEIVHLAVSPGAAVQFHPARVRLLPVTNRGITYPVPTEHLSQRIDPGNLFDIAACGLAFYNDLLNQANAYFVEPTAAKR